MSPFCLSAENVVVIAELEPAVFYVLEYFLIDKCEKYLCELFGYSYTALTLGIVLDVVFHLSNVTLNNVGVVSYLSVEYAVLNVVDLIVFPEVIVSALGYVSCITVAFSFDEYAVEFSIPV